MSAKLFNRFGGISRDQLQFMNWIHCLSLYPALSKRGPTNLMEIEQAKSGEASYQVNWAHSTIGLAWPLSWASTTATDSNGPVVVAMIATLCVSLPQLDQTKDPLPQTTAKTTLNGNHRSTANVQCHLSLLDFWWTECTNSKLCLNQKRQTDQTLSLTH